MYKYQSFLFKKQWQGVKLLGFWISKNLNAVVKIKTLEERIIKTMLENPMY